MSRLEGLQQDNASLEHEIRELHQKKAQLMKQIEKSRQARPLDSYAQLKELLETPRKRSSPLKKQQQQPQRTIRETESQKRKRRRLVEDYMTPEPIEHEFFDESIAKYFTRPKRTKPVEIDHDEDKVNNVILENVYRMFGITAFPVKDPSRSHLAAEPELLGIRIEIFNELELKFETPHYLILEKMQKTGKWSIFKSTVPSFVQVHELAAEYDGLEDTELLKFLKVVRGVLNKTCLKHQIVEKIKTEMRKEVRLVQKDISMENLGFTLCVEEKEANVMMRCSLDDVVSCSVQNGFSTTECERIGKVLKGDLRTLQHRLASVVGSIADHEV